MPFWDEVVRERGRRHPGVELRRASTSTRCAAKFVLDPGRFDVIVASNLFGDILSDLGRGGGRQHRHRPVRPTSTPSGEYPSMFEPVHGSAPDIAGQGIANPIGAIWSGAMMLDHLGHAEAAAEVVAAIAAVLARGRRAHRRPGRHAATAEVTAATIDAVGNVRERPVAPASGAGRRRGRGRRSTPASAATGPPLLLLHGYPQTHAMWHRVAPALARATHRRAADLRGYGDSGKPATPAPTHAVLQARDGADQVARDGARSGFERFAVAGHDRGARVGVPARARPPGRG